ncbi:MAG: hypothetical protein NC300_03740 [Bacteroidales bacterium]|nr:hypothetical protein [Clostridium sp.]MCM1203232.1 hypothetical protein [Bacteroidales bacterium]
MMEKLKEDNKKMSKKEYTILNKHNCCGKTMVTVIIGDKANCVMLECDRIIEAERKFEQRNKLKIQHRD